MLPPKHKRSTDEIFNEPQRLHKVLASCGFGSRRAMEEMILAGRITVNRMPADVGQKVSPGDEVRINGELVKVRFAEPRARVLMYHKPSGELVTRDDPEGRPTVFEKLPSIGSGKWINVGRLDYNTEGLLLFTNSGELANRLMHPRYEVEREYAVRIMGRLTDEQAQALTAGIALDDGPARCEKVTDGGGDEDGSNHWYHVVLKEGRNREVRRLFEALGLMVSRLIRTRYGMLAMPTTLKRGNLEELEAADVTALVASAGLNAPAAGGAPRNERREGRGRQDGRKGAPPPQGQRPPHKGGQRRGQGQGQGQGPGQGQGQGKPQAPGTVPVRDADARGKQHHVPRHAENGSGQPGGSHPAGARPPGRRGPGPKHRNGDRAPRDDAQPSGVPAGQRPPRAPRVQHNFDEVQPQSNANASPFGRSSQSPAGGGARGYNNDGGPRHRSGPRAHGGKFGNGNGGGFAGSPEHRRAGGSEGFKGPGPGQRPAKRPRGDVDGNGNANGNVDGNGNANGNGNGNANGNANGNGNVAPRAEVNGNVAPPGEKKQSMPDDDS